MDTTSSDQPVEPRQPISRKRKYIHIAILIISIAITVIFIVYLGRLENLQDSFETYGYLGVFLMGVIGSSAPVWPIPGSLAAAIAGALGWNIFLIAVAAGVGEAIGELIGYMFGFGGQIAVERIKFYPRIVSWMKRRGSLLIFLASAVPNHFVKVVGAAAGALHYPAWKYYLISCAGKILKSLGFAIVGVLLGPLVQRLLDGEYTLWIILVAGVAAAVIAGSAAWWWWYRGSKAKKQEV